jgi:hypothetical protein
MRRRTRGAAGMPEHVRRYDWREWREPAEPDDPFPEYSTWYLGLFDWQAARDAWQRGVLLPPKIQIPQTRSRGQRQYVYDRRDTGGRDSAPPPDQQERRK